MKTWLICDTHAVGPTGEVANEIQAETKEEACCKLFTEAGKEGPFQFVFESMSPNTEWVNRVVGNQVESVGLICEIALKS